VCSNERLLKVEIRLLSNYPKRRRHSSEGAGRITVDAREKDITDSIMHYLRGICKANCISSAPDLAAL
jgi:hypothetical protein